MRQTYPFVLDAALAELATQYSESIPDEVLQLFPRWMHEMPDIICTQTKAQLSSLMAKMEPEMSKGPSSSVAIGFAKAALQAAIEVHDKYGPSSPTFDVQSAFVQRAASESEAALLAELDAKVADGRMSAAEADEIRAMLR